MVYFVYILRSSSNQLYIGQTNNLDVRTIQHITKNWKAAKFIKDDNGFKLAYSEEYPTRLEAIRGIVNLKDGLEQRRILDCR